MKPSQVLYAVIYREPPQEVLDIFLTRKDARAYIDTYIDGKKTFVVRRATLKLFKK